MYWRLENVIVGPANMMKVFELPGSGIKSIQIAKQPIGATHNPPHIRTQDQWECL